LNAWLSVVRGKCPRCGGSLKRVVAVEESYTRKLFRHHAGRELRRITEELDMVTFEITPVYSVCERCGFRIRRKNIKTKLML